GLLPPAANAGHGVNVRRARGPPGRAAHRRHRARRPRQARRWGLDRPGRRARHRAAGRHHRAGGADRGGDRRRRARTRDLPRRSPVTTDNTGGLVVTVVLVLLVLFVIIAIWRAVRIVPQAVALIVERLGKFNTVMYAGLHFLIPFVDRVRAGVDLREQVVSFPPQPVITSDNLVVSIDTVIYFQVTDPKAATYEIANYITGIEQLTVTTLRNVIGSMDLEQTLTSRDQINGQLRGVLDEAT